MQTFNKEITMQRRFIGLIKFIADDLVEYRDMVEFEAESKDDLRDSTLCTARAKNISKAIESLNELSTNLSKNNGNNTPADCINKINNILNTAYDHNDALSREHGKIHKSYAQNRLAGLGIFASWHNKTFFQSRATRTLEKVLDRVTSFEKKFIVPTKAPTPSLHK
jgi:hypothetical protein